MCARQGALASVFHEALVKMRLCRFCHSGLEPVSSTGQAPESSVFKEFWIPVFLVDLEQSK